MVVSCPEVITFGSEGISISKRAIKNSGSVDWVKSNLSISQSTNVTACAAGASAKSADVIICFIFDSPFFIFLTLVESA